MLHCLVFKEQLCLSKRFASSDFYILSHRVELVKKFFLSFFKFFRLLQSLANQGFWALAGAVSLSDLYYDTVYKMTCQQLFAKKIKKRRLPIKQPSSTDFYQVCSCIYQMVFIIVR